MFFSYLLKLSTPKLVATEFAFSLDHLTLIFEMILELQNAHLVLLFTFEWTEVLHSLILWILTI